MIRFASLGSGSKGNATLIESGAQSGDTRLLLDCGYSTKEIESRLSRLGRDASSLTAILITHEHSDHVIGAGRLSRKYNIPVWLTVGTSLACKDNDFYDTQYINCHEPFEINGIELNPFPVPHDAREPCQFVFSDGSSRLAILTDLGCKTKHVTDQLDGLDALLLECNYNQEMLLGGSYPRALKERVNSASGHLDNRQATEILQSINISRLKHVIGMHVSEKNNTVDYASEALCQGLDCGVDDVSLASQASGFDWREV